MTRYNPAYFSARTACPVCDASDQDLLYAAPMTDTPVREWIESHFRRQGTVDWDMLAGTDYALARCGGCALIYQQAAPNATMLEELYTRMISDTFLATFENGLLTVDAFQKIAGELALLFKATGKHPADIRFLDYGSGYGRWGRVARALGASVYATEIGDDKLRAMAGLGIRTIEDAEIDAMRFDIVHTEQVFEHLVTPRETFVRLAASTDGILKVSVPRYEPVAALLKSKGVTHRSAFGDMVEGARSRKEDAQFGALMPLEHLNMFSPKSMTMLAQAGGMRITGTARRRATTLDLSGAKGVARSAVQVAKAFARELPISNTGYYLFQPVRAG
jgi:2-polyprenyl-3-methyl-5-hydroxy-6-metoxy-1,4-benzoquinol methylase